MSKYSHRTVKELKTFIKKYNEHFRIMLTGKKKPDLIKEIEDGMKKTVTDELKKAHMDLLTKTPKPKQPKVDKPKVEKPKEQPKKTMKKEDEVRPAKKAFPPIPKNIRGKRVNVKFEKPATKERIETGDINLGKLEEPKPKLEALKVVKGKKKSIELEPTKKLKTIKVKKAEPKKKAPFLEELKETDISILEDAGNYDLQRGGRCSDLITVSQYIIKADKDKFKKVRIFKLSDIKTDIRNVGSWELNNPTPLAIIYNYFFQLIEDEKYLIRVKNDCGVRELLFVEKAYKILLDNFDLIKNKIIEQNKKYNPKIESIMKERKLKDIEFNLTEKKEEPKGEKVKKAEPKKEEPKKAEPKKEEPDAKNQKKIMSALNSINNDINEISQLIRSNPKFNIDKPTLTEKQVFKNSMFDNLNDLESAIKDFDNQTFFLQNKEIKNKMDDIKDKMPFILDQIKKPKSKK